MRKIYLDNASTTPLLEEVKDFLCRVMDVYGNPSSLHAVGEEAKELLELARENIATLLSVKPNELIFNSCATEGNNTIIKNVLAHGKEGNIVISSIEHKSVSMPAKELQTYRIEVREARVDKEGRIDLNHLEELIDDRTLLVSVMAVSNEFGTVQPIEDVAHLCGSKGVPLHTDSVQALGKLEVHLEGVSYATFSGHKCHAPKGIGLLFLREGSSLKPLLTGGGQERGLRSGTENLHGILGLAKALEVIYEDFDENVQRLRNMRDRFEEALKEHVPDIRVVGENTQRNPSISAVIIPGRSTQEVVGRLSELGVFCSAGSACSAGEATPNPHLIGMGYTPQEAMGMLRFSFGLTNTMEEAEEAVEKITKVLK